MTDESDIVESKISTTGICVNVVQSDAAYSVTAIKRRRRGEEQRDEPASNLTVAIGTNAPHSNCSSNSSSSSSSSSNSSSSRNKSSSSSSSSIIKTSAEGGDDAISVGQYRANNWSCDPIAPRTFQVSRLKSGFSGRVSGDASAPTAITAVCDDLSDGPGPGPAIRAKAGRGRGRRRGGGAHVGGLGRNTAVVVATASVYVAKRSSATATRVSEKRGLSSAVIKAGRHLAAVPSPSTSPSPIILKKRGRPPLNPNHQQTFKDPYQHHNLQVKMQLQPQLQADSKKPARTRGYGAQDGRTITGTAPVAAPQALSGEPTEARPMVAQLPSRRAPKRASAAVASSMGGWGHLLKKQRGKNG